MLISALLGCIHIPLNTHRLLFNRLLIYAEEFHGILFQPYDLFILNKIYIPRILKNCRNVRSNDASPRRVPYDQRTVLPDRIKFIRMIFKNNSEGIGPFHPVHDLCHGTKGIPIIIVIQKMRNNFRICLRNKRISFFLKPFFKLQIIFNNTVMYDHDTLILIKMRMRVRIRGRAMSRPPRMSDPHRSRQSRPVMSQLT